MIVRLLTILAVTLPLAACAAQPAGSAPAAQPAGSGDAGPAQAAPAAAPASPSVPAAADRTDAGAAAPSAQPAAQETKPTQPARAAGRQTPAGSGASGRATADTAPAPAAAGTDAPAASPAPAAAPDVVAPGRPAAAAPAPVPMQSGSPTGSLMQTLFALILVLAVLAALAWFLKRYGPRAGGGTAANLRVVGSLSLGGRERLLVVEVGNQWIVVGASPGRVNALATMPKQDAVSGADGTGPSSAALAPHGPAANSFADWLRQTMDKRK